MTIAEIHSQRSSRRQIFNWLKQWIHLQPIKILEIFLRFITGTTRIPLSKKITVCISHCYYFNIGVDLLIE